jgi:hypothetical protein
MKGTDALSTFRELYGVVCVNVWTKCNMVCGFGLTYLTISPQSLARTTHTHFLDIQVLLGRDFLEPTSVLWRGDASDPQKILEKEIL